MTVPPGQPADPAAFVAAAHALLVRGRPAAAVVCCGKALAADPDHVPALNTLGLALQAAGQAADALHHHARALALDPEMAETHAALGNAHRLLGRLEDAAGHYRRALALRPGYAAVHNDLAGVLHLIGRTHEAVAHYRSALAANPRDADANYNAANLLAEVGWHEDALPHYRRALEVRPAFAEAHNNMANALQRLGRHGEAAAHYTAAAGIRPGWADAWHNLGKACFAAGGHADAIAAFGRAVAVGGAKASPDLHRDLGAACLALGRLPEARAAYQAALARDPRNAAVHLSLAGLAPFTAGDPRLAALEDLAVAPDLPENDRIALGFALAQAHADRGNGERSFRHLLHANGLKRRQIVYDEAATLGALTRTRAVFSEEVMRTRGGGDPSPVPVFIVGMPRSGSTLIEQILASHSAVFGAGEIDDFERAAAALAGASGPPAAAALGADALARLGQRYLEGVTARAPGAARITDKMLSNFAHVGLIHLALPHARIVYARRDDLDTCLSCFSVLFGGPLPWAYDLGELGRYCRACAELMDYWRTVLPEGVMLEVHYEDLVDDLEGQTRRLLAHCGLPWQDRCLDFHLTERPVHTASVAQVRRPLYRSSVGRSRAYGDLLDPLVEALEGTGDGRPRSFADRLASIGSRRGR